MYNEHDIDVEAKVVRLKWAGHVFRREEGSKLMRQIWEKTWEMKTFKKIQIEMEGTRWHQESKIK